jgi:hypothetical protein
MDQIEMETCYPKIMLEQRMNHNIHFREVIGSGFKCSDEENDFMFDIDS